MELTGLDPEAPRKIEQLKKLWQRYGKVMNLTAGLDDRDLERQVGEAGLVVRLALKVHGSLDGLRWLDVGSGAGFPALVVVACQPGVEIVCVEPRAKRAAFLEIAIGALGANGRVYRARAGKESWEPLAPGPGPGFDFDIATARAVFAPEKWLEIGSGFVRKGGDVIVECPVGAPSFSTASHTEISSDLWCCRAYRK